MRIWAYCIAPAKKAVRAATGVDPLTSPPWTADLLRADLLRGHDLLYFRLHGWPSAPFAWWGEGLGGQFMQALRRGTLLELRPGGLRGATVVVANCHGAESPMLADLYAAGAETVIAGYGPNLAGRTGVAGTDRLVQWVIRLMRRGWDARRALGGAKVRLALSAWRAADRDAMGFKIMEKGAFR